MSEFDFPAIVDAVDSVPESFRGLYQEKDGKFQLAESLRKKMDTSTLTRALKEERENVKSYKQKASLLDELGKSPEEIKALVQEAEEKARKDAEKSGEFEKIKTQMLDSHTKQLTEKEKKIQALQTRLQNQLIGAAAAIELANAKGDPVVLMPYIERCTKIIEDGDDYKAVVINAKGEPRVNDKGEYLTIKDLVAELREDKHFGKVFEGDGKSGSGTPPSGSGGGGSPSGKKLRSVMTPKEKSDYITEHGLPAFQALPWK